MQAVVARLTQSPDPDPVFTALADALTPELCDTAVSTVVPSSVLSGAGIHSPAVTLTPVIACPDEPGWFTATARVTAADSAAGEHDGYAAAVSCRWQGTAPGSELLLALETVCRQAASTVLQVRLRALVVERTARVDNLSAALTSNRMIGAGIGVLMANHRLTYDQAHLLLSATSQRTHQKMAVLAQDVLYTGTLPS